MGTVALLVPCYVAVMRPGEQRHAEAVLRALGEEVDVLDGLCCGQPAYNSGYRDEAKTTVRPLLKAAGDYDAVIVPSGSCTSMLHHYAPGLFGDREEQAAKRAHRFHEFASYVANHPRRDELNLRLSGVVSYHDSCHGRRELGITETVVGLLESIEGLDLRRLQYEYECCGFGGAFSVKQPEVSTEMGTSKLRDVEATGTQVLVSADLSCLAHLGSLARAKGQPMETWSLAEVLARSLP